MKTFVLAVVALLSIQLVSAQNFVYTTSIPGFSTGAQALKASLTQNPANGHVFFTGRTKGVYEFNGISVNPFDSIGFDMFTFNNGIDYGNNRLYVAKSDGLYMYDNNLWVKYTTLNTPQIPDNNMLFVNEVGGTVYAGTNQGLVKYMQPHWYVYNTANSGIASDTVNTADLLGNNTLLAGTKAGLSVLTNGQWVTYNTQNSPLARNNIQYVQACPNNTAWVVADGDSADFSPRFYFYKNGQLTPLKDIDQNCLYLEAQGKPYLIDPQGNLTLVINGYFKRYAFPDGPPAEFNMFKAGIIGGVGAPRGVYSNYGFSCYIKGGVFNALFDTCFASTAIADSLRRELEYGIIDINNMVQTVRVRGDLFADFNNPFVKNESPKGSCKKSNFISALWMGGVDNGGNLKTAGMTYRQSGYDYWAGPIDTVSMTVDAATQRQYTRVWKINKSMIEYHQLNYMNGPAYIADDILNWPAHGNPALNQAANLAPFVDLNNNGLYEPLQGEYPELTGDEMLFWIFNDVGGQHSEFTGCSPMGVEVHATAYAFVCNDITDPLSADYALNNTVFYKYKIYNRSSFGLNNFYVAWWHDSDLGKYNDDYVGCDTMRNAAFEYNGDNDDEGPYGYGLNPPMQSYVQLNGPPAPANDGVDNNHNGTVDEPGETILLSNFLYYNNDFSNVGNVENCGHIYNYMRSIWKDNTHLQYGGSGHGQGMNTNYMFPTAPYSDTTVAGAWNEEIAHNTPSDRRFLMSSGGGNLDAHANLTSEYAIVFSHYSTAPNGATTSLALNNAYVDKIQQWYDAQNFPSCLNVTGVDQVEADLNKLNIYPNPANSVLNIAVEGYKGAISYCITDMAGKTLACDKAAQGNQSTLNIGALAQGIYLLTVTTTNGSYHTKFVKQ